MDKLIKLRGPYRSSFTKFTAKVQDFLNLKTDDSDTCAKFLAQLQEKYAKVKTIDEQVLVQLQEDENCTETLLENEIEATEDYNDTFIELKTTLERCLYVSSEQNGTQNGSENNSSKSNYKLPKIEFLKFDGNLKNYLTFWELFKKIHEDPNITEIDKFQYLLQSTQKGSRAREVIESFPITADNYQQAVDCLKSRFGREDILIEVYVRELLSLVLCNALGQEHKLPLVKLYDRIETQLRSLKILGVTSDKYASMLYPLVESSLPVDLLRIWERHLTSVSLNEKDFNKLESLMQFLRSEIEGEEKINLATSGFGFENKSKRTFPNKAKFSHIQSNTNIPTGMELLTSTQGKSFNKQCIFCDKAHDSTDCWKADDMTYDQKKQILMKRGGCFRCLKRNHISTTCRSGCVCTICGKPHHFKLCRTNKKEPTAGIPSEVTPEQALANVSSSPCVLLQTLAVILKGKNKSRKVRAIFDSASQRSYILRSTAEKVGYLPIKKEKLKHSLFGGSVTNVCEHDVYKAHLARIDNGYRCNFDVLSQSTICETMPPVTTAFAQDEISDIGIHLDDKNGPIELLIGADVAGKLMTGRLKSLKSGLTAVETRLGWTVLGRTREISDLTENLMVTSMLTRDVRITDPTSEKPTKKELETTTEDHFLKTLKKDTEGRYPAVPVKSHWWEGPQFLKSPSNERPRKKIVSEVEIVNLEKGKSILCDGERLMNSRRLMTLSEDTEDLAPLKPNMFLQGVTESGLHDLDNMGTVNLKKRFRYLQKLRQDLRNRFRIEYLGQLKNSKVVGGEKTNDPAVRLREKPRFSKRGRLIKAPKKMNL